MCVGSHWCDSPRVLQSLETGSRMVSRGWGSGGGGKCLHYGYRASFWTDGNIPELNRSGDCTTWMWIVHCKMTDLMLHEFYFNKKGKVDRARRRRWWFRQQSGDRGTPRARSCPRSVDPTGNRVPRTHTDPSEQGEAVYSWFSLIPLSCSQRITAQWELIMDFPGGAGGKELVCH